MKKAFLSLLIVGLIAGPAWAQVTVGEPAKDFTLTDVQGKAHSLSDFRGKYVVLEWFNYDCPFVKKHYGLGNMQTLQREFTDKGVIWLSINSSAPGKQGFYAPQEMDRLAKERDVAATAVLLDNDGKVGHSYGAQTTPHMFIIDPEGKLIYQGAIDDTPGTDPEEISGSKNYVRSALQEALAGKPVTMSFSQAYGCSVKY